MLREGQEEKVGSLLTYLHNGVSLDILPLICNGLKKRRQNENKQMRPKVLNLLKLCYGSVLAGLGNVLNGLYLDPSVFEGELSRHNALDILSTGEREGRGGEGRGGEGREGKGRGGEGRRGEKRGGEGRRGEGRGGEKRGGEGRGEEGREGGSEGRGREGGMGKVREGRGEKKWGG